MRRRPAGATTQNRAEALFEAALEHVESVSIQSWAKGRANHDIWLRLAAHAVSKGKRATRPDDVSEFAAYIVATAMGM